jgi:hypothetical protein
MKTEPEYWRYIPFAAPELEVWPDTFKLESETLRSHDPDKPTLPPTKFKLDNDDVSVP